MLPEERLGHRNAGQSGTGDQAHQSGDTQIAPHGGREEIGLRPAALENARVGGRVGIVARPCITLHTQNDGEHHAEHDGGPHAVGQPGHAALRIEKGNAVDQLGGRKTCKKQRQQQERGDEDAEGRAVIDPLFGVAAGQSPGIDRGHRRLAHGEAPLFEPRKNEGGWGWVTL